MKQLVLLVLLGLAFGSSALAQRRFACNTPLFLVHAYSHTRPDSAQRYVPFEPTRFGGFLGLSGFSDQRASAFGGVSLSGHYRLTRSLQTGVQGSTAFSRRISKKQLGYPEVLEPMLDFSTLTWSNGLLLSDNPRTRVTLLAGVGVGWATLRDQAQQVPVSGGCGCDDTEPLKIASTSSLITETGLSGSYKLKPELWLTVQGQYRWWYNFNRRSLPGDYSHYVLSIGVSLPDAARRR
ncbi:hypothetical protein [Hymenobacter koreensis]|uniref:Outer membrane protein beta-barrel domain-containing protein n=1 Tax=Hymenobacter koreensis TaxID=1084523 RepID=A0ABP8IYP0_9BACT